MQPKKEAKLKAIHKFKLKKETTSIVLPFEQIRRSDDAEKIMREIYKLEEEEIGIYESFYILLLNRTNKVFGYAKISQGGVTGTVADPLIMAKISCEALAKGIMLVHNHPSGNLQPSHADIELTRKIKNAMLFLDITVLDHLIMTEDSFMSLADEGMM